MNSVLPPASTALRTAVLLLLVALGIAVGSAAGSLFTGSLGSAVACAGTVVSVAAGARASQLPLAKRVLARTDALGGLLAVNLGVATLAGMSAHTPDNILTAGIGTLSCVAPVRALGSRALARARPDGRPEGRRRPRVLRFTPWTPGCPGGTARRAV